MSAAQGVFDPGVQCHLKRTFVRKQGARRAARQTMSRGGRALVTYRCPHCDRWHNGHPHPLASAGAR